jgi:hypothetical protein
MRGRGQPRGVKSGRSLPIAREIEASAGSALERLSALAQALQRMIAERATVAASKATPSECSLPLAGLRLIPARAAASSEPDGGR